MGAGKITGDFGEYTIACGHQACEKTEMCVLSMKKIEGENVKLNELRKG